MTEDVKPRSRQKPYFAMTPEKYRERMLEIEEPDCMFLAISPELYEKFKQDPVYGPLLEDELKSELNQS